jgi:hypothetical protein
VKRPTPLLVGLSISREQAARRDHSSAFQALREVDSATRSCRRTAATTTTGGSTSISGEPTLYTLGLRAARRDRAEAIVRHDLAAVWHADRRYHDGSGFRRHTHANTRLPAFACDAARYRRGQPLARSRRRRPPSDPAAFAARAAADSTVSRSSRQESSHQSTRNGGPRRPETKSTSSAWRSPKPRPSPTLAPATRGRTTCLIGGRPPTGCGGPGRTRSRYPAAPTLAADSPVRRHAVTSTCPPTGHAHPPQRPHRGRPVTGTPRSARVTGSPRRLAPPGSAAGEARSAAARGLAANPAPPTGAWQPQGSVGGAWRPSRRGDSPAPPSRRRGGWPPHPPTPTEDQISAGAHDCARHTQGRKLGPTSKKTEATARAPRCAPGRAILPALRSALAPEAPRSSPPHPGRGRRR